MVLLDGDRCEGRFRDAVHVADVSDLMRQMIKEKPLKLLPPTFPGEARTHGAYKPSHSEAQLYRAVTESVIKNSTVRRLLRTIKSGNRRIRPNGFAASGWPRLAMTC